MCKKLINQQKNLSLTSIYICMYKTFILKKYIHIFNLQYLLDKGERDDECEIESLKLYK